MKRLKIKDIFKPVDLFNGEYTTIFDELATYEDLNEFINGDNVGDLTIEFFIGHSGDKYITKRFYEMLKYSLQDRYQISLEEFLENSSNYPYVFSDIKTHFSSTIYNRFGAKWIKIYNALNEEYNPLENYSMSETRTPNLTETRTPNITHVETRTPNITHTENASTTSSTDVENGVYGFNSTNSNPSTDSQGSQTDSIERTDVETGSETRNNTETGTETKKNTGTETLTRSGNIGVTSSQQLLESELELRKYDFYQMIYNDIDSILCLKIY